MNQATSGFKVTTLSEFNFPNILFAKLQVPKVSEKILKEVNGGEYRNRTGVRGFAIQEEREQKQQVKDAKHPLIKGEQKAKVSTPISPVQNEKGPVTAATVNRGQIEKACQLSKYVSMSHYRSANAQSERLVPLAGGFLQ